jgi:hypothetical protein
MNCGAISPSIHAELQMDGWMDTVSVAHESEPVGSRIRRRKMQSGRDFVAAAGFFNQKAGAHLHM